MTHRRRDEDVDACDRFEREGAHLEVRLAQCRLHGVHDLARQKGCDDGRRRFAAALSDERLEFVAVERVADRAVADAVVARWIIDRVGVGEFLLRLLYPCKVEVTLLCGCNRAREVLLCIRCHRVEGTPCRRHSSTGQRPCTLHEAVLDLADDGSDLRHIVNLPVEHGARAVLEAIGRQDVQQSVALFGDNADHTARPNIERKDKLLRPLAACRCGLFGFLRTAALLCRRFRLLLHTLLGAAAPLCGRRCSGGLFVRCIQIRHFDLPCQTHSIIYIFIRVILENSCHSSRGKYPTKKVRTKLPYGSSALTGREGSEMPYILYVYTCVKQVGTLSSASAFTEVFHFDRNQIGFPRKSVG